MIFPRVELELECLIRGALWSGAAAPNPNVSTGVDRGALWSTWSRANFLLPFLWPARSGCNLLKRRLNLILDVGRTTVVLCFEAHIFFFLALLFPVLPSSMDVFCKFALSLSFKIVCVCVVS